jgi:hypothetical protein
MSHRYAQVTRRDLSEPAIVEALEKAGWEVHKKLPTDLLAVKRRGNELVVKLVECKTLQGKKSPKARIRKEQIDQNGFLERHGIPRSCTPAEALAAVGETILG